MKIQPILCRLGAHRPPERRRAATDVARCTVRKQRMAGQNDVFGPRYAHKSASTGAFLGVVHRISIKFGHFVNWGMAKSRSNRLCVRRYRRESAASIRTGGAPMAKAAAVQTTVTLKHLAAALADSHEMAKKQSELILTDLVGMVVKHLKKGDRIRIGGLGIFQVRKRAARMGRNPATGEQIKIKASKKVAFRAAKELKEAV
jgi:DNA-binding protein HU-beta